jgi:rubrerythrin
MPATPPESSESFRRTTRRPQWGHATRAADFRCVCPHCGTTLREKECKSRCPECHYFTDCSDPW